MGGGGGGGGGNQEGNEQEGRQPPALPADVERQVAVAEHQQQHRRDEQVEVGEEPPATGVVRHVADRVDVDQRADTGDQQHEGHRERVDQQPELDVERPGRDEGEQVHADRAAVDVGELDGADQGDQECDDHGGGAQQVAPAVGAPAAEQQHRGAGERQRDEQPG